MPRSSKWYLSSGFSDRLHFSFIPPTCPLNLSSNKRWRLQITKLLFMHFLDFNFTLFQNFRHDTASNLKFPVRHAYKGGIYVLPHLPQLWQTHEENSSYQTLSHASVRLQISCGQRRTFYRCCQLTHPTVRQDETLHPGLDTTANRNRPCCWGEGAQ